MSRSKQELGDQSRVQLYGVCSTSEPLFIVQEYMAKGNLLEYLQSDRGRTITFDDQVHMGEQVANGMAHLESINYIHRDLAARNVLLGENYSVKICDFGLARAMNGDIYHARGGRFPLKWTAPEAFSENSFTIKSDVWSYGIFLMELFTFGVSPYEGIDSKFIYELVTSGYRMAKPPNLPDEIYDIMMRCWNGIPYRRPTFRYLEKFFSGIEVSYKNQSEDGDGIFLHHNIPKAYEDHEIKVIK